ncbi:MAG: tripartite tricarboxylate transporter TctB family protein [Chloroflexi bacterium]|nr:tripartite tricarboxylate transporter TctB family protein [Chloroflexota bacterium]
MSADHDQSPGAGRLGPRLVAVVLLALGLLIFVQTFSIRQGGGYSAIGPRFFPLLVAIGLLLLSGLFLARTTIRPDEDLMQQSADEEAATHWPTVGLVALALVVYAVALGPLGYILATVLFFPVVARFLGSTRPVRDIIIALVISVVIYEGFTRALGVRLPAGLLQGIV